MTRLVHHSWLCPFSRKVRLALGEKKLPFALQAHRPGDNAPDFQALNPDGYVPVLIDDDGTVLTESAAITEYLEELYPEINLLGSSLPQRTEVRRIVGYFDSFFFRDVTQNLVCEKVMRRRGTSTPSSVAIREGHTAIHHYLARISSWNDRRRWLAGESFSLADCAVAGHVSALDYLGDVPWDKHPGAKEWYVRVKSRLSFRPLLLDRQPAIPPAPHYHNLDF